MFKIVSLSLLSILMISITGCVPRDVPLSPVHTGEKSWGEMTNVDDVNMSDFDENLTESEMIMTEVGEENKLERIPFPTHEYYKLARIGKGTIKGKIYVSDAYGKEVLGANTRLYLNPYTSYSRQWYEESYLGGYRMQKADSRLFNYLKFTAANAKGEFSFYGVPSGRYYLIGTVKCAQECGYASEKSIRISAAVSVHGSQILVKNLTRGVE